MPTISAFFGILIRMFYNDHGPAHFHAEYQGERASFDFNGTVIDGQMRSRTARQLVKEWADLHRPELEEDWQRAREGLPLNYIEPLQ
ncbi:MAG TPA: DUF4160 domain-containing protein [Thermoanaerobaculia bacterium]|nr:DUF4160 domain-containing protein [Thermoanaerobaculia bacterium]